MPRRKGVPAPQNSFLDTIATRFDGTQSCFLLGSAQVPEVNHIIYCSDGFCTLTGHPRAQVMLKSCSCDFLYGEETSKNEQDSIRNSLAEKKEFQSKIWLYKKDNTVFQCLLDIVPIRDQNRGLFMFLVSLKEIPPRSPSQDENECEEPFLPKLINRKNLHSSEPQIPDMSAIPAQRRRSRAVLYNLSGQLERATEKTKMNSCSSISNMFSGSGRQVLDYQTNFSEKKSSFTIIHYGISRTIWDWLILMFTLYVATIVPYYAALQSLDHEYFHQGNSTQFDRYHYPTFFFDLFLELVFILDIALNFRTTFVNKRGQLVSDPKEIAINYLKSTFLIDFVAAVPFDFISFIFTMTRSVASISFQLLKIVRLLRIFKLYKKVDNWSQYRLVVLLMLMLMFGMAAHWMACIWFSIGWAEFEKVPNGTTEGAGWLFELSEATYRPFNPNKTGGPELRSTYITALYFTLSSLTSVGFGNVSANTDAEKMFSICVMLMGAIMHAVVFGSITAIIQRMYEKRSEFDRKERNLTDFMRIHRIPKDLKRRMIDNFQGRWAMNKGVNEIEVVNEFPKDVQADIAMHLHKDLLNLPLFKSASEGCRRFTSLHASRRFVAPSDTFIHVGDPLEHVFLVCSGSLEVSRNHIVSAILSKGDLFGGDVGNDSTVTSHAIVKALTFCEIQCISFEGLRKIEEIYPEQFDIAEVLRTDFSCQLWEEIDLQLSECKRQQRDIKIKNWDKHYSHEQESSESSDDSDNSCVYYPAITVSTNKVNEQPKEDSDPVSSEKSELEKGDEGYHEDNANCEPSQTKRSTLQIPGMLTTKAHGASPPHSSAVSPCPSPCLRPQDRRNSVKKRVSFNDSGSASPIRKESPSNSESITAVALVNELSGTQLLCSPTRMLENPFSSTPESPLSPEAARRSVTSMSSHSSYHDNNSRHKKLVKQDRKDEETSSSSVNQQAHDDFGGRWSSSPGTSSELRKRRRRRKPTQKIERMSSSSLDEGLMRSDHSNERQRRVSVVDVVRDSPKGQFCRRDSSPDSRNSDHGTRMIILEERLENLQSMVSMISGNVERILSLHDISRGNQRQGSIEKETFTQEGCDNRRNTILFSQRSRSAHDIMPKTWSCEDYNVGYNAMGFTKKFDLNRSMNYPEFPKLNRSNSTHLGHWRRLSPRRRPAVKQACHHHRDGAFRPRSAPMGSFSPVPYDCDNRIGSSETLDGVDCLKQTSQHSVIARPIPISTPRTSPTIIDVDQTSGSMSSLEKIDFQDSLACRVPERPNLTTQKTENTSVEVECDKDGDLTRVVPVQRNQTKPNFYSNLPTIAISNYDDIPLRETVNRLSPSHRTSPRQTKSHLVIPATRRIGGSESGYSTSSPSPDISCV